MAGSWIYANLKDAANTGIVSQSACQVFFGLDAPGTRLQAMGRGTAGRRPAFKEPSLDIDRIAALPVPADITVRPGKLC